MTQRISKQQMLMALDDAKVDVAPNLPIAQLRSLYQKHWSTAENDAGKVCYSDDDAFHDDAVADDNAAYNIAEIGADKFNVADKIDAADVATTPANLQEIENEIVMLRKRQELLELRQRVRILEGETAKTERKAEFGDVEHVIPKFSGDDQLHAVQQFIRDFEEVMYLTNADERFKLLSLRLSLTGTAHIFLSTTPALSYSDPKHGLIKEFG